MTAKPLLKYAGGKTVLLPEILKRLPAKISTYYEPFVGGGAVFFALAAEGRFKHAVIGDANKDLMRMYAALAIQPAGVIRILHEYARLHGERRFYEVRAFKPSELSDTEHAARVIYLNRTCFNGLWRVNKKGEFNVPFGKYTNPKICDEENLHACSKVLREATLFAGDFAKGILPKMGDVFLADPPYFPVSSTANFASYTRDGFTFEDQKRLRDVALQLKRKGVHVLLCNSDTPAARKLYAKGFKLHEVSARRNVNSKADRRGPIGELLIM